jgi:hypothetical protein
MYVDGKNINRVVETILNMHRRNLLWVQLLKIQENIIKKSKSLV